MFHDPWMTLWITVWLSSLLIIDKVCRDSHLLSRWNDNSIMRTPFNLYWTNCVSRLRKTPISGHCVIRGGDKMRPLPIGGKLMNNVVAQILSHSTRPTFFLYHSRGRPAPQHDSERTKPMLVAGISPRPPPPSLTFHLFPFWGWVRQLLMFSPS